MKILSTWALKLGAVKESASRFLAGEAVLPPPGATLLGRWHKADGTGGFSLVETNDPTTLYASAIPWADVLEIHAHIVIEDAEAGPILAKTFAK
jgi:Protein of unknown function (DUF3303)